MNRDGSDKGFPSGFVVRDEDSRSGMRIRSGGASPDSCTECCFADDDEGGRPDCEKMKEEMRGLSQRQSADL